MDCTTRIFRQLTRLACVLLSLSASPCLLAADDAPIVNETEELPQGLAIVPWKKTAPGQLEAGPVRLVEEPLQAIDPEVFRRQHQLQDKTQTPAGLAAGSE